jgi:hypothetical protein
LIEFDHLDHPLDHGVSNDDDITKVPKLPQFGHFPTLILDPYSQDEQIYMIFYIIKNIIGNYLIFAR